MSTPPSPADHHASPRVRAFSPLQLAGLRLRNRFVKSATYEGMSPGGRAGAALLEHHAALARGGVALTTVAYCAVEPNGRTFAEQLGLKEDASSLQQTLNEESAADHKLTEIAKQINTEAMSPAS